MSKRSAIHLLPAPRSLVINRGIFILPEREILAAIKIVRTKSASDHAEGYALTIDRTGVKIQFREPPGLRAATATLRQLRRQVGRRLPCLKTSHSPQYT